MRAIRVQIQECFINYCFELGPDEIVNNPPLLKKIQRVEKEYIENENWSIHLMKNKMRTVFKTVSREVRNRKHNQELENKIEDLFEQLNQLENKAAA